MIEELSDFGIHTDDFTQSDAANAIETLLNQAWDINERTVWMIQDVQLAEAE